MSILKIDVGIVIKTSFASFKCFLIEEPRYTAIVIVVLFSQGVKLVFIRKQIPSAKKQLKIWGRIA